MIKLDIETLRELLEYNPNTGKLKWRSRGLSYFGNNSRVCKIWNTKCAGKEVGSSSYSYVRVSLNSISYKGHRVAWAIYYGEWPKGQLDHINGVKTDNRIVNLREVFGNGNSKNMPKQRNNTSGVVGVYWFKRDNLWKAQIQVNNKSIHLGYFTNKQDAINARKQAEMDYGFHPNHGRVS